MLRRLSVALSVIVIAIGTMTTPAMAAGCPTTQTCVSACPGNLGVFCAVPGCPQDRMATNCALNVSACPNYMLNYLVTCAYVQPN